MIIMVWKGGEKLHEYQRTCPGSRAGYTTMYSIMLYPTPCQATNSLMIANETGQVLFFQYTAGQSGND